MNYNGNMPDWHQFNASQTNEVTSATQNVNSGHLAFIPGVSPPTLNALSLSSEGLSKHQNDTNFNSRNYQSFNNVSSGANISNNSPLVSMAQMQNCISHYTSPNARNPMLDNLNSSVDPRNTAITNINDDMGYRSNQVPFNGPMGHLSGPSCNLNTTSGPIPGLGSRTNSGPGPGTGSGTGPGTGNGPGASPMYGPGPRHGSVSGFPHGSGSVPTTMGPRNTNMGSIHSGKPGPPSYMPCKGLCCNSDPNINYQQWEKFGSYQNNTSYRDNVHPSNYQMENRHFGSNCNFRKDNLEGKEAMGSVVPSAPVVDHRRNYTDYKYHKDHLLHRNYSTSAGMFPNYPIQNYNYSTEHPKYPYPVKEHPKTNNMNIPNSGMLKHSEQNFIPQQKYNNKQFQYQNGNMLPKAMPAVNVSGNMVPSSQNGYFNSQFTRNIPTEMSHECQEATDNTANRLAGTFVHNSPSQHQTYQHKIAMQKFSMENHLRELSRIPGYQSHSKYKECVMRYRQLLKLQQSTNYQNPVQTSRVPTPINTAVPPINLQFDQNGMLINSSYLPDGIPKLPHAPTTEQSSEIMEKQIKNQTSAANEKCQQTQQSEHLMIPSQSEHIPPSCVESFQKQDQYSVQKDFNQNQLIVQTSDSHSFDTLNTDNDNKTIMQQKTSKEFDNKPELDVRQFLANWDETDDEEGTSNLPVAALNDTTPVVVVSYENVDLSSKTLQNSEMSQRDNFPSSNTILNNDKEAEENIATQDCLTISYSSSEATTDVVDSSKQTIQEGVVKPGSIIHCISNGPDEIPTIHIVDNLEISNILGASNDQVIETLEKQKTISFFRETANNKRKGVMLETTEQHDKDETHLLSADYDDVAKDTNIEDSNISETIQTATASINNQELRALSSSTKSNLDVTNNLELKKQNSFVSEESHNPDDISLPDLPTSECTPISTTLNTPIHSDSEESSQNMEDLSISTNPIEVMQNSPVISFTQSPVKMEPYGQLNNEDKLNYKGDINNIHEQEATFDNFPFTTDNAKVKSLELTKDKQAKSFGTSLIRKKVYLIEGKERDVRVSDTCEALTSIAYELGVQQEAIDSEKNTDYESSNLTQEGKQKRKKKLMDSIKSVGQISNSLVDKNKLAHTVVSVASNVNLVHPIGLDNETQSSKHEKDLSKKQKIKNSNISVDTTNPLLSEVDLSAGKRVKENIVCVDKYINRNINGDKLMKAHKKDEEYLMQSKHSDIKLFVRDGSISSQDEEQSVCHMTSQYKNYSIAVIKDTITLSDKKSHGTAEKTMSINCEKPHEFQLRTNCTKDLLEEVEMKKYSQNYKRSEVTQKDLDTLDEDTGYTAGEMRLLNEYNGKDDKLHQNKNMGDKLQKENGNIDKAPMEQNVSSQITSTSDNLDAQEKTTKLKYKKSFVKNTNSDFGIQVANVNLKFKDSEIGKELIFGDKGQEHIKDTLDSIKIEINVSCAERNLKGHEQSKRLSYEIDDSSCSNILDSQHRIHSTEQEMINSNFDIVHKIIEKSSVAGDITSNEKDQTTNDTATSVRDANISTIHKSSEKPSSDIKDDAFQSCLTSDSQSVTKLLQNNTSNTNEMKSTNYSFNVDTIKTKSAISNTAITDVNNKLLIKTNNKFEEEDTFINIEGDRAVRTPNRCSNVAECSSQTVVEAFKNNDEKKVESLPYMLKSIKKLPDINFIELNSKSSSSLNALDFTFDKLDYKKYLGVKTGELDDNYIRTWKKPKIDHLFEDCGMFQSTSGYINPIFSNIDKSEDLHTVPVYTTKDGKISYSPNRRFTYHELMMETRSRETGCSTRKSHYMNTLDSHYSSKFRKFCKKKRHHGFSDKKKHEYKDTKYLYEQKKNYLEDFCGKNHVKCKNYVHGFKNTNAVWSNHSKIIRTCSSSDSDEEIVCYAKNIVAETSDYRKNHATENKPITVVSKSQKLELITDNSDLENKHKRHTISDTCSCKSNDTSFKETQLVQFNRLDNNKQNESVNEKDNIISLLLDKSCTSENLQPSKDKNLNEESVESGNNEIEDINVSNNDETSIERNKMCSLSKSDQVFHSCISEKAEDSKIHDSENPVHFKNQRQEADMEVRNNQSPILKIQNTSEDNDHTETLVLETNQNEKLVGETDKTFTSDEMPEDTLVYEVSKNISTETTDILPKSTNKGINDKEHTKFEKIIIENETEFGQNIERVQTVSASKEHEENINKNTEETIVSSEREKIDPEKDISKANNVICTGQEVYESQIELIDATTNQQNLKCVTTEIFQNNETVTTDLTQVDIVTARTCVDSTFTDFSKTTFHIDEKYTVNNSLASVENTANSIVSSIKETSMVSFDNSEEHLNASYPDKLQDEYKISRESSVENEMPILSMYCATENSSTNETSINKETDTKEYEQKKEECQLSSLDSCPNQDFNQTTNSSQGNIDIKMIPKLVIKKTDALSSKIECLSDYTEHENSSNKYDTKLLSDARPKIPKMIIMKNRSRSATPTTEIVEKSKSERIQPILSDHNDNSMDVDNSDSELYTLKYKNYENKVPKVKIKLEDISSKDLKLYLKRKATKSNVSKVKVKKIKIQEKKNSTTKYETENSSDSEASGSENDEKIMQEPPTNETEKIPKLKLRKQDEDKTLLSERTKEKDTNISKAILKKTKRTKEEDAKHCNNDEIRKKYPQCITEKIPKVIIKRTQIGAEFKCEIRKGKMSSTVDISKWQPKVKLQRLKALDHLAKDIKQPKLSINNKLYVKDNTDEKNSDCKVKLCRSSSASHLSPIKCKQRRFSDPDYMKLDIKSTDFVSIGSKDDKSKLLDVNEVSNLKIIDSENKNLKKKGKEDLPLQSKRIINTLNDESENEIKEIDITENDVKDSFENHLIKEDNDPLVERRKYPSFGTKESMSLGEDKCLLSNILCSRNFDDNDNSIIKIDSSDESQTTIELLPASPNSSDDDSKNREFESITKVHLEDAIPTQLELELDLIDNRSAQHTDTLAPKINILNCLNIDKYENASHSKDTNVNKGLTEAFFNHFQRSSQSAFNENKIQSPKRKSNDYFYCNDLLVKEVLAAKETLKKCLTRSVNDDTEERILRSKTVAEKKQGLNFNFKNLEESYKSDNMHSPSTAKKEYEQINIEKVEEKHSSIEQQLKLEKSTEQKETSHECPMTSTCGYTSVPESSTISLKTTKKFGQITVTEEPLNVEANTCNLSNNLNSPQNVPKLPEKKSEKKTISTIQDQKDNDSSSETKIKEDNMPLLVPEFALNFDSSSDRDSSRSPPVITNQEEIHNALENVKDLKNKVITPIEKIEESNKHSYKDCEMTIADIITQLAYHEKATIKHRRYCNLCERWFPTTSRHRRHLAGYQHRYMELTQRKSIHALFILFTGKPCPRLLPANVIRNDCSIGELTPLQIAVQDVANYVEPIQDLKTIE
ncbi:uncharacterized protein LOC116429385 [Nomia melanderi]|uniref:uncharacterized protein LOC116429385 n=1 Tax=Nomia melanderi TaxID=2448451 RepID=UPI00130403AE|nr:uncharacterized protein LOC116429385 [Nomia melanderi]XP_031838157.1 uncharacterized protein LOC116429385 [Nomia melanderi]